MLRDVNAVGTDYLNSAFGWDEQDHLNQHDIQEAMRIIFDTIERALFGTKFQEKIVKSFKGTMASYKECKNCTVRSEKK